MSADSLFQFHKGTIKTHAAGIIFYRALGFQFHKGTIKTSEPTVAEPVEPSFQFHKGTIKTTLRRTLIICLLYFNSIKVRLKLSNSFFNQNLTDISIP